MGMDNAELGRIFREIALYLEMRGEPFKPRAYEKVAYALEAMEEPAAEIYKRKALKGLREIPGVGAAIADKIEEIINTGRLKYYQDLKRKMPVDIAGLTAMKASDPRS